MTKINSHKPKYPAISVLMKSPTQVSRILRPLALMRAAEVFPAVP